MPWWIPISIIGTCLALMLAYWGIVKPDIRAYFLQGSTTFCCVANQITELTLEFENKGISTWKRYLCLGKRGVVQEVAIAINFPSTFEIHEISRQNVSTKSPEDFFQAPDGCKYVFVPDPFRRTPPVMTALHPGEIERCRVKITAPSTPGTYPLSFGITSGNGGLRCKPITLYVMTLGGLDKAEQ